MPVILPWVKKTKLDTRKSKAPVQCTVGEISGDVIDLASKQRYPLTRRESAITGYSSRWVRTV